MLVTLDLAKKLISFVLFLFSSACCVIDITLDCHGKVLSYSFNIALINGALFVEQGRSKLRVLPRPC